jgi:DNA invertase Pin-like site-specific DNA recombinase
VSALRDREMRHFLLLDRNQQAQAIRRLVASGMSGHTVATATGLSVEQVRRVLGAPETQAQP